MTNSIAFDDLKKLCAQEGLTALGVLSPVPNNLDPTYLDLMETDGLGDLEWIRNTRQQRLSPTHMMPRAKALLAVAMSYQKEAGNESLQRARYAAGKDYHHVLRSKLGRIGVLLGQRCGSDSKGRAAVDSAPLNERTLAHLAGLGWLGKNALLIAPAIGSYRLLGFLLTDAPLEPHHAGHGEDRCGSCNACEKRCPTAALRDRRVLTTRCISYLTIEHKGVIDKNLAQHFEGWWFGCDLCQEVCPWNRFARAADDPRLLGKDLDRDLLQINAETFDSHFAGRAIRRIGYERFRRNLLVALYSLGRTTECQSIISEALPLVVEQAHELGLITVADDKSHA